MSAGNDRGRARLLLTGPAFAGHDDGEARIEDSSLLLDLVTPSKPRSRTSSRTSSPRASPRLSAKEYRHSNHLGSGGGSNSGSRIDASPRHGSRTMLFPSGARADDIVDDPVPASGELRPSENPLLGGRVFDELSSPAPARLAALREHNNEK